MSKTLQLSKTLKSIKVSYRILTHSHDVQKELGSIL